MSYFRFVRLPLNEPQRAMARIAIGTAASGSQMRYSAKEPNQTRRQKRAYGLIALGIWVLILILMNLR